MKKNICIICTAFFSFTNAQFSTSLEFISFAKKDYETKKNEILKSDWKFIKEEKNERGEKVVFKKGIFRDMQDSLIIRKIIDPVSKKKIYETEYISSNESIYPWRAWYTELKSQYSFIYSNGRSTYNEKSFSIIMSADQPKDFVISKTKVTSTK